MCRPVRSCARQTASGDGPGHTHRYGRRSGVGVSSRHRSAWCRSRYRLGSCDVIAPATRNSGELLSLPYAVGPRRSLRRVHAHLVERTFSASLCRRRVKPATCPKSSWTRQTPPHGATQLACDDPAHFHIVGHDSASAPTGDRSRTVQAIWRVNMDCIRDAARRFRSVVPRRACPQERRQARPFAPSFPNDPAAVTIDPLTRAGAEPPCPTHASPPRPRPDSTRREAGRSRTTLRDERGRMRLAKRTLRVRVHVPSRRRRN